jgi:hypothetical protein
MSVSSVSSDRQPVVIVIGCQTPIDQPLCEEGVDDGGAAGDERGLEQVRQQREHLTDAHSHNHHSLSRWEGTPVGLVPHTEGA